LGWVAVDARAPPRARRLEEVGELRATWEEAGELRGEEQFSLERDECDKEEYHHARCILDSSSARLSLDEPSTTWRRLHQPVRFELGCEGRLRRTSKEADISLEVVKGER
jgi:hypothetical protein